MGFKGGKDEMLKKQYTPIFFLLIAFIYSQPLAAIIVTPDEIKIYQSYEKSSVQKTDISSQKKFPIPYLFSIPKKSHASIAFDRTSKVKYRQVNVQMAHLKNASKINLNLFPDLHRVAAFKRMTFRFSDDFTWLGAVDLSGNPDVILTVKGNALYGHVTIDNQMYHISPILPPLHEIALMDYSDLPSEHPPIEITPSAQKKIPQYHQEDGAVIHLMVLYTRKASDESPHIDALIQLAIDETNLSFEQSGIQTRLNLIHVHQVDYKEQDIVLDLKRLAGKNDGFMDDIHLLRDQYAADIVVMMESSDTNCGVSYLNPDADFGFCIVSVKCVGNYAFAHEIGHLFGAYYNPEGAAQNNPYPYGHGYLHVNGWRSIMALNLPSLCPNGMCRRVLQWSNPGIRFQGTYTGSFLTHNNSRVINESSVKLANFRHYGNKLTIHNNENQGVHIQSIVPSNTWLSVDPTPTCPFTINKKQSRSFHLCVDWQKMNTTSNATITINNENHIQIIAVPSTSLTALSVVPNELTCSKNISIRDIQINGGQNFHWRAFSNNSWLTIIDGYSGIDDGTVRIRVAHNDLGMREGSVSITAINSPIHKKVRIVQTGNRLTIETPQKVRENDTFLPKVGKISIPSKSSKQINVKLTVSDVSALVVPEDVIIPEGKKSVLFDIHVQDNTEPDGPQRVDIFADADGWIQSQVSVRILDDESGGIIYVGENQAYETIQSAIEDAAPKSSILVLSGTYYENIHLTRPVHLYAANGPAHTIINGSDNTIHTIEIAHENIVVEGFTIIGADTHGKAGIYLAPQAKHCLIKNNICGQDEQHFNYYGIFVDRGGFHTLSQNLCQHNRRFGIHLDQSSHNTIVKNTCQLNQCSGLNLIQSQNNMIYKNILKYHPKYGLNLTYNSNQNTLFLNAFINNDRSNVHSQWSINQWQNEAPVNHYFGHGFLGNYFDNHPLDDCNDDGITDTFYYMPNNETSAYPLSNEPEYYESQTQIINQHHFLISDEMAAFQSKCLCAAGETVVFQSSPERHGTLEWTERDAQTGNICFVSPIQNHHRLLLQLGKVAPDGAFTKAGSAHTIIGDGATVNFPFCIFPGSFLIDTNEQFAFQITNESNVDYSIWIGGGHTHISPYTHDHNNPLIWTVGKDATFRSIQSALSLLAGFQTDRSFTLTVLPGTYTDNIIIEKPVSLISSQGYTQTVIAAKRSDHHVIHILSDHVRIEGFSIYGANTKNASGLCIDRGVAYCDIAHNRFGFDRNHSNDFGVIIHASIKNTLHHNQCIGNEKHGIWLDTAFMNQLAHNSCDQNQENGMHVTGALMNHFTNNICENNGNDGIHLVGASRNQIQFNTIAANENMGLFIDEKSFINLIYLNNFVLNQKDNVFSQGTNLWMSDKQKTYQYCGHVLTDYMGNYYGDSMGQDDDHNGLIDAPYIINGIGNADSQALVRPYSFYDYIKLEPLVLLADNQAIEVTRSTLQNKKPEIEKAQPQTLLTTNEDPITIHTVQNENFVKVENELEPIQSDKPVQPILLFTNVPNYGNRLKDLKGLVLNVEPDLHHIAVYIHIKGIGWRSKPYPKSPMTPIDPDGRWECDITTSAFDQNADIIVAVLYVTDLMPPTLINAPVLPDTIFEKAIGLVRNER